MLLAASPLSAAVPAGMEVWNGRADCEQIDTVRNAAAEDWVLPDAAEVAGRSRVWVRFPMPPAWPPMVLAVPTETAHFLWVYRPGLADPEYRSLYEPAAPHDGTAYWHSIPLVAPASGMAHLCLFAPRAFPATLRVLPLAEQLERELNLRSLVVGSFAVMLAMSVFALVFWIALRDRLYLYYFAHVLAFILWAGFSQRIFARFLSEVPGAPTPLFVLGALTLSLSAILIITFAHRFLDLRRGSPRSARVLRVLAWSLFVAGVVQTIVTPVAGSMSSLVQFQNLLIGLSGVTLIAVALRLAWQGNRYARYFCLGWTPFLLLVFLAVGLTLAESALAPVARIALLPAAAFETFLMSIGLADRTLALKRERDAAMRAAERDSLTGVLNRRGFEERWAVQAASGQPGALLICDLDHFKSINDRYGHPAGDQCLKRFAERAERVLSPDAVLGRFGGEEFLIYLPSADADEARQQAERLRAEIAAAPVVVESESIPLTVSIGVLIRSTRSEATLTVEITRADAALYRAKAEGRNRVVVAESDGAA